MTPRRAPEPVRPVSLEERVRRIEDRITPWRPTLGYLAGTESHVYALAVAASVLLAFFPFLIVMVSLCQYVLNWPAARDVIYLALGDYFPGELGAFIVRNLKVTVAANGPFQITSVFLLLFTANGVFEPLEVALNRVWGVHENRSYLKNQAIALGLIFLCGGLALLSFSMTAMNHEYIVQIFGEQSIPVWIEIAFFKLAAVPISILALFFMYWLLPNRRIPPSAVLPVALYVGLILEVLKYLNLLLWPYLRVKLQKEYGPFSYSVTIVLLSFVASLIVLAGAEWTARRGAASEAGDPVS